MSGGLHIHEVTKRYGNTTALDSVSHVFKAGMITTIVGPSGSGKSTMLSIIAGLLEADSGSMVWQGQDLSRVPAEKRDFGLVFQNYALFPHLNVLDNVAFGLRVRKMNKKNRREKAMETLKLLKVDHLSSRQVTQLSGGEQQRVALARALAIRPRILLMDEPLSALDAQLRETLRHELFDVLRELEVTTIYVTHDQVEAMSLGHEIIVMNQGRIEQIGIPTEVYRQPVNSFVASFLGAVNMIPVELDESGLVDFNGMNLELAYGNDLKSGSYWLTFHPEDLSLGGSNQVFEAQCERVVFSGSHLRVDLQMQMQRLVADLPNHIDVEVGQVLRLALIEDKYCLIPRKAEAP